MAAVVRTVVALLILLAGATAQVSVRDFGARGDGIADDTSAFRSALDSIGNDRQGVVILPPGLYRITAPIVVRRNQSIQGSGAPSIVVADFAKWLDDRRVALLIENAAPASEEEVLASTNRVFSGFVLRSASGIRPATIGVEVKAKRPVSLHGTVNHAVLRSVLRDISIRGFETGLSVAEMWDSSIEDLHVQQCRRGVVIAGQSVDVFMDRLTLTNFPEDNNGDTIGLLIDSGVYVEGEARPEGIVLSHSVIYGADTLISAQKALFLSIHDNVLDGARRDIIVISSPEKATVSGNYLGAISSARGAAVRIDPVNAVIAGPEIIHNKISGADNPEFIGILVRTGGKAREAMDISRNTFERVSSAIVLEQTPTASDIESNTGSSAEANPFIYAGAGGRGAAIVNNRRTNKGEVLRVHKSASRDLRIRDNIGLR